MLEKINSIKSKFITKSWVLYLFPVPLQQFLLELGKGFAFMGRQQRITLNNRHYFVDLVFYHVKLKCYVLIDLKIGEVAYEHIGQMKLYLGYYTKEI